jgi:DNA-binding MarR family transcriptional regulator
MPNTPKPRAVGKLVALFDLLRDLNPEMPAQSALTLLLVAQSPGIAIGELQQRLNVASSTMSRNISIMSEHRGKGEAGLGLIETREDVMDRRIKRVWLTARGENVLNRISTLFE